MRKGDAGSVYNIGGGQEMTNLRLAKMICEIAEVDESLIEFVDDRLGHDLRYSVLWQPLASLGWAPRVAFPEGIRANVAWYRDNQDWSAAILEESSP